MRSADPLERYLAADKIIKAAADKKTTEAALTNSIRRYLRGVPGCCFEKRHGSAYARTGQPDISGCVNGRRFEIEVKAGDNKPTEIQTKRLEEWAAAGAAVAVVWDLDAVKKLIGELRNA